LRLAGCGWLCVHSGCLLSRFSCVGCDLGCVWLLGALNGACGGGWEVAWPVCGLFGRWGGLLGEGAAELGAGPPEVEKAKQCAARGRDRKLLRFEVVDLCLNLVGDVGDFGA
jgi:hypothetical protein